MAVWESLERLEPPPAEWRSQGEAKRQVQEEECRRWEIKVIGLFLGNFFAWNDLG